MSGQTTANQEFHAANQESSVYSYHLTLFSDADEMYELWLPKVPEGYFRFSNEPQHRFLSIFAQNGQWVAACQKPAFFKEVPIANSYETPLCDGELLKASIEERTYLILTEKVIPRRNVFHNYSILPEREITIGSQPDCAIYYRGPFVSRRHASISRTNGQWRIRCADSLYGMYINGEKKDAATLKLGDVISIMGLKILVGHTFLSINSGLGEVTVNPTILQDTSVNHSSLSHYYAEEPLDEAEKYFNRAPRKRREEEQKVITVEGPPMPMNQKQMPLMLRMGGSMVMGGSAALAGNFMTLITSVMFPFLSSKYTENQRQEYEKLRVEKYTEYLQKKQREIAEAIVQERNALNIKYPQIGRLTESGELMRHLWERRPVDSDFLQLRLGTGIRPLSTAIDHPPRNFELEPDDLEEKMFRLVERAYTVDKSPIVLSLTDTYICGIEGYRKQVLEFICSLILQIAMLHSYDEVKMVFLMSRQDLEQLDDIRYLPHVWDDQRTTRLIATNEAEAYAVGEYIKGQITEEQDDSKNLQKLLKKRPFYIVFALDKKAFDAHEVFKQLLQADANPGAAVISAHGNLPKESQKIITLKTPEENICTTMGVDGGEDERFSLDPISQYQVKQTMRELSNLFLKKANQAQAMPKLVTFLEMFKVGRVEQLNPLKRWRENNPTKSLATPVGVGEDGSLFMLDLHEKRQGPHGLVAGMTGSGKSEFLISYILSMAVNYHPDEAAFVLIDYKGGGLADAFENPRTGMRLPHLAGTITNLDGASIQRSLMSIESELVRRQRVFSEVSKSFDEGSMNIYTYQKLYRAGKVAEPMPHLFIISDEFAELKQQQPEFMDKLISAARIGRSLGVHLILATQKPSGVVNDQIRSNTKFRVCLRVQERSDSQDMLKRSEAAELTDTGRFYLQVGYNEYFALGQSAWCGAAYEPQDTVPVQRDDAVEFLDITGQVTAKAKPKVKKTDSGMKQIVAVVKYLSDLAAAQGIQAAPLCQPALPRQLDLEELQQRYPAGKPMAVTLGMLDDPENQKQIPMFIDFETCGNLLITGETGGGKTTVIQNILFTLAKRFSPKEFHFYALDYSSRMLKIFKPLPHCGAIIQEEDAGSLDEFFKLINGLVAERKQLFSELEVDSFEAARAIQNVPLIIVVIDNLSGFSASKKGEAHSYKLQSYLKNSALYGIKYILTGSHLNEISPRIRQEFSEHICMHMREKFDYGELLGCKVVYTPPELPGRGLCKHEDRPLEFQSGIIQATATAKDRVLYIKEEVEHICCRYGLCSDVQRMAVIDEKIQYTDFAAQFKKDRIPLGYSKMTNKPVALPIKQLSMLSFYLGNPNGVRPILENMLHAATREDMSCWIVKRAEKSCFAEESNNRIPEEAYPGAKLFTPDAAGVVRFKTELAQMITQRLEVAKAFSQGDKDRLKQPNAAQEFYRYIRGRTQPVMILFESFADFCSTLDGTSEVTLDKFFSCTKKLNIYLVALFEPEDEKKLTNKMLYACFNKERTMIFLGGQTDKQSLCELPKELDSKTITQFNLGFMHYRKDFYPILMPCGEVAGNEIDPEMLSIF